MIRDLRAGAIFCALVLSVGCASGFVEPQFESNARPVPIARLLSTPSKFDGVDTIVIGVLVYDGTESVLYQSREDAQIGIQLNGVAIDVEESDEIARTLESLSGQYVMVFGRYRKPLEGSSALTIGRLTGIGAAAGATDWGREEQVDF